MAFDPYRLLGVSREASEAEIRRAYRLLARQLHPDLNKDPAAEKQFKELTLAYSVLSDVSKRELFDRHGEISLTAEFLQNLARQQSASQPAVSAGLDVAAELEIAEELARAGGAVRLVSPVGATVVTVRIPPGTQNGAVLRLPGKGRACPGQRPGDLRILIRVRQ